jgi:hypothetical protein
MQFDFLKSDLCHQRARNLIDALFDGARGLDAAWLRGSPRPDAYVVLYGLGGSDRLPFANRERLIAFDVGYWDRQGGQRKFRVSVGGFHCPQFIMQGPRPAPDRFRSSGLSTRQGGNPTGPIILVGNAPKSISIGAHGWTAAKSREIRAAFPGRRILYRPKPKKPQESGVVHDGISNGPIDDVLQSASLVVCRHSNVAVDACRIGVPVVCDDGAAAAIYPQRLEDWQDQPSADTRIEFLHRLAYWQWSEQECRSGAFWDWMKETLLAIH